MTDTAVIAALSAVIALMSFGIAATTMYFAWLRPGRLAMTKPTIVFFGYDTKPHHTPKLFIRTLLYSTAAKGKHVEGMYVKLKRADGEYAFDFWGHGEREKLSPGSGLYVGQTGVSANHHFVYSEKGTYAFEPGEYAVRVYARVAGQATPILLDTINLTLSMDQAIELISHRGVLFRRGPDDEKYTGEIEPSPTAIEIGKHSQ